MGAGIAVASTSAVAGAASGLGGVFFSLGATILTRNAVKVAEKTTKANHRRNSMGTPESELMKSACWWHVSWSTTGCVWFAGTSNTMVTLVMAII